MSMDAMILTGVGVGFAAMGSAMRLLWNRMVAAMKVTEDRLASAELKIERQDRQIVEQARHISECEQDRVVLLRFSNHAIATMPELGKNLEQTLTATQLIRLTREAA